MLSALVLALLSSAATPCSGGCFSGSVRFVTSSAMADYSVRWVGGAGDVRVEYVTGPARKPGEWQVTASAFADYAIYEAGADEFADFTAVQVSDFPGCN